MPRRREVPKREILPDPVYNSQLVTKFINSLMDDGKKAVAERVFYGALKRVEDRANARSLLRLRPEIAQPFRGVRQSVQEKAVDRQLIAIHNLR